MVYPWVEPVLIVDLREQRLGIEDSRGTDMTSESAQSHPQLIGFRLVHPSLNITISIWCTPSTFFFYPSGLILMTLLAMPLYFF